MQKSQKELILQYSVRSILPASHTACEDSNSDSYYETDFYYGDDVHQENAQADYEEYLNNLSSKESEIMDARNARAWKQAMKDEDDYVE